MAKQIVQSLFQEIFVHHDLRDDKILVYADETDNNIENALVKECVVSEKKEPFGVNKKIFHC